MKTAILLYEGFSEYELSVALSVLMQGKKEVVTFAIEQQAVHSEGGLTVLPDHSIVELEVSQFDSLILPGCIDIGLIKDESVIFQVIQWFNQDNKLLAAISSAPFLLGKAGVLQGHRFTAGLTSQQREFMGVFGGAKYEEELVVRSGHLITAKGRGFIQFGLAIGNALGLSYNPKWYGDGEYKD